jgi:hypothetical protein
VAKIRNVSGEDRYVPWLHREVKADEVASVPDSDLESYTSQPDLWADATPRKGN